jgi:DNA replication and repair protein RecF
MLSNIRVQNFRSYGDTSFEFEAGVNIIVGPNASGKTNLLEAILMLSLGKSYRGKDAELINNSHDWARLDANYVAKTSQNRTVKLEAGPETTKKTFVIDNKEQGRLSLPRTLPLVLFEPNHLFMLIGPPEARRTFLDDLLSQTMPGYNGILRNYKRALAQRNSLLKQISPSATEQLFVWDVRLSEIGAQIFEARGKLIDQINQRASEVYGDLSKTPSHLEIRYNSRVKPDNYGSSLLNHLQKSHQLDIMRGFTGAGPHREDFTVFLDDQVLSQTGSRGEHRTVLLTLKIIELQLVAAAREQKPLLLLDDVFSELDGKRRKALTNHLDKYQTFITTTDADLVVDHFAGYTNVIAL